MSNPANLGEGISLHQVCRDAVYVDHDFAVGRYLQCLDRIQRLGLPAEPVTNITGLIAPETLDELVDHRLEAFSFPCRVLDDPAVVELGDLEEETPLSPSITGSDISTLFRHLR